MQSLRTRRPSETRNQKPAKPAQKLSKPQKNANARKSRVDDKIKKRFSMRYGDISSPTSVSVPSVPALPIGVRPGPKDDEEVVKEAEIPVEDARVAELQILDSESFDPDTFLKVKMARSTESEIKSLELTLKDSKAQTDNDLRKNVFKNYSRFMTVSKEINTLENDMLELKSSLSEWKNMPALLHIEESTSALDRRRTQRASIADLRVLYASQMQELHSQIEGSSNLVPTNPGRHIVSEMEGVSLLNPATYKVEHNVKIVLFDDAVLVAKFKQRRTGERSKLVAERCWPLSEILVLDTKDTSTMTNVFKIRQGKDTYVFRTDIASEKKTLLSQFRQIAEELATKRRKEREGEFERRKSMRYGPGTDFQAAQNLDFTAPMPEWIKDAVGENGASAKEKNEKDKLWMDDFTDRLTVAVALHHWEEAVSLVEEGELKVPIIPSLNAKLTPLTESLSSALQQALAEPTNRKSAVVQLTGLLQRLHKGPAARKTFLGMRSELIRKHVRMIQKQGSPQLYIFDLSVITFTSIKHTADWFLNSFKDNDSTSCFVSWAKEQIEKYAETFRLQVFNFDLDEEAQEECIQITHAQSKRLLQEFGLDFHYLFEELLVAKPRKTEPPRFNSHKSSLSVSSVDTVLTSVMASTTLNEKTSPVEKPLRPARSSPAPPPRSSNRPGSSAGRRPAPIVVPAREGML